MKPKTRVVVVVEGCSECDLLMELQHLLTTHGRWRKFKVKRFTPELRRIKAEMRGE